MKECKMLLDVLPEAKLRSGLRLDDALETLGAAFGHCTLHHVMECHRGDSERVYTHSAQLTVAIDEASWPAFRSLARELAQGQTFVYVVGPFGNVEQLRVNLPASLEGLAEPLDLVSMTEC